MAPTARRPILATLLLGTLLSGCGSARHDVATTTSFVPASTTTSTTMPTGKPPALTATPIATLDQPMAMAQRPGDPALYIAQRNGLVRRLTGSTVDPAPVLDLSAEISTTGAEQGLLGLAFSSSGKLYVDFTGGGGNSHVVEFQLDATGTADQHTRREVLEIDQPYPNHNGGQLVFGPDQRLYIGTGDGGGSGDPLHNGQNLGVLLGKILRIDPTPTADLPYTIPYDNPFAKRDGARGEIWAYGLRNPWRFTFDRTERGIWIGDVGEKTAEEVDHVPYDQHGGQDYEWPLREGDRPYAGDAPADGVAPIYVYGHSDGACSVIGGYVYRGDPIPALRGRYLFADHCTGRVSTLTQHGTEWLADPTTLQVEKVTSFGEDRDGNLYILSQTGTVARIDAA